MIVHDLKLIVLKCLNLKEVLQHLNHQNLIKKVTLNLIKKVAPKVENR